MTVEEFLTLTRKFAPMQTEHDLIRIGPESDGGYLVPDDLDGIEVCFSPGVSYNAGFEGELKVLHKIDSHQADYSVDTPPPGFLPLSFTKKYIGAYDDDVYMTMESWMKSKNHQGDLLLQMDIEGAEYESLLATPNEVLKQFRIIVLEIHNLETWTQDRMYGIANALITKLSQNFVVVHNHPNNFGKLFNIDGIEIPETIEITLLRRDRCTVNGPVSTFPHELDRPCGPHLGHEYLVPPCMRA